MPPTYSFLLKVGRREEDWSSFEFLLLLGGSFSGLTCFGGGVYSPNQLGPVLGGGGRAAMDPVTRGTVMTANKNGRNHSVKGRSDNGKKTV